MMLSATTPIGTVRSSLEEMLNSLRCRDEAEKPKDLPPALPARPTSRGRLPSARRSLPTDFKVCSNDDGKGGGNGGVVNEVKGKEEGKRKEKEFGSKMGSFGSKNMKRELIVDSSPYVDEEGTNLQLQGLETSNCMSEAGPMRKMKDPEWDDNIGYYIKKKLRVWCRLPSGQWELGVIQSTLGEEAFITLSNGNAVKVATGELLPANPDILEGVDDLIQLSYLNEPSVLHNLHFRYSQEKIYSKAGPLMIAVNPFKDVNIYGHDFVADYRDQAMASPHVYAIADIAYNEMMRDELSQSIIISGESGAGKTETAKFAMQYLAALGGIEYDILQTNCILEAFGNAKTSRNDNSSRFGKLIEIHFSTSGKICGAKIQTFLLEKSRVVQLAAGERSYHIFYQICAGASSSLRARLNLKRASDYNYLNQSECLAIDGVDDAQRFCKLMEALDIIQICKEDQEQLYAMLTAVLWLGNISFQVIDNENHVQVLADEAVNIAARLLGCSMQELMLALCTHKIQAGKDIIAKKLTMQQAIDVRDALAKFIYESLFDWLVGQINMSLEVGKECSGRFISILDIYGFESFKKNSFEQFCINYANERLQQHFNRHLFKLEQEEYVLDGVDWTKVEFEDNQECLNLIEKKPIGLLSLLDEESNFPKATDLSFANKLKQHLSTNPHFKGERDRAFGVHHYAGEVQYDTNGFLEKNRDLHYDFIQLLSSCRCQLPLLFASKLPHNSQKMPNLSCQLGSLDSPMQSVGAKFKGQLFKLMNQLENTTPHFICCIKPNNKQLPGIYEEDLVFQQLKCCGVLEVVRISRYGYPTRVTHQEFAERYGFLLLETNIPRDPLSVSVAILQQFNVLPEMYQVGYTKLFLRTGQIAAFEEMRKQVLRGVVGVQKHFRGCKDRRYFHELKKEVVALQSFIRGENSRRNYDKTSRRCTANSLQTPDEMLMAAVHLQSVIRGWLARKQFREMRNVKESNHEHAKTKQKQNKKISEAKDVSQKEVQVLPSALAELQRRVCKAEATLGQKEEENAALRKQLQQFETSWSEYETKMKRTEEMWQKQMSSLQMSLTATKKSIVADSTACQPGRRDTSTSPHCYDSEEMMSTGSRTPGGSTPIKFSAATPDAGASRETKGNFSVMGNLVKEFEQQRQTFDDDAKALVEYRAMQSASRMTPDDELRKLKFRFEMWKKEYKVRLRETKARLHKLGHADADKIRRKWWGKIGSRAS